MEQVGEYKGLNAPLHNRNLLDPVELHVSSHYSHTSVMILLLKQFQLTKYVDMYMNRISCFMEYVVVDFRLNLTNMFGRKMKTFLR